MCAHTHRAMPTQKHYRRAKTPTVVITTTAIADATGNKQMQDDDDDRVLCFIASNPVAIASQPEPRTASHQSKSLPPAQPQAHCLLLVVAAQDQVRHIAQRDPAPKLYSNFHK